MSGAIDGLRLEQLAQLAQLEGFVDGAAMPVGNPDSAYDAFYRGFIAEGSHADLGYLARPERDNLRSIYAESETLLVFLYPYRFRAVDAKLRAAPWKVARYAWQRDYHESLRAKLARIAGTCGLSGRAVTDSAPLPERYWARSAGLGRIGRNGMLISRQHGSYFLIASLLVSEPLTRQSAVRFFPGGGQAEQQAPVQQLAAEVQFACGDCRLCIDACPTQALKGDGLMDIRSCISYRTIESKNAAADFPRAEKNHRWVFGCDVCQQVCPYNKPATTFAADRFNDEHAAAEQVANGQLPAMRSALKGSVFFRRGLPKLAQNIAAVSETEYRHPTDKSLPD